MDLICCSLPSQDPQLVTPLHCLSWVSALTLGQSRRGMWFNVCCKNVVGLGFVVLGKETSTTDTHVAVSILCIRALVVRIGFVKGPSNVS